MTHPHEYEDRLIDRISQPRDPARDRRVISPNSGRGAAVGGERGIKRNLLLDGPAVNRILIKCRDWIKQPSAKPNRKAL